MMFLNTYNSYQNFDVFSNIKSNNINILYTLHNDFHKYNLYNKNELYNINECFSCDNYISDKKTIIRCFDKSFCCKNCLINPYNKILKENVSNCNIYININNNDDIEKNEYFDIYSELHNNNINTTNTIIKYENIKYYKYNEHYIKKLVKFLHKLRGFISILIRLNKNTNIFNKIFIMLITLSIIFYHKHISHTIE
jgi:hypothetical protein